MTMLLERGDMKDARVKPASIKLSQAQNCNPFILGILGIFYTKNVVL
jgi:hypothetical protein